MKKLKVNQEKCISCGACITYSRTENNRIFVWDDNGKAKVASQPKDLDKKEKELEELCPVDAIEV